MRMWMQAAQIQSERLFLNSVSSSYTRHSYRIYLQKYLQIVGYHDLTELLSRDHKQVENEIIEFIITFKEKGMKYSTIINYIKPVISFCKINDIMLNTKKINRFMPPKIRSKKTTAYTHEQIQRLLDIADERMRAVILLLSSTGSRIGSLPGLNVGNLEEVNDLYKITIYENEPEEYTVFCTNEARTSGIEPYLRMRERYGEIITNVSPLVREQFDKRDPFAIAHPRRVKEPLLARKLTDVAEAAGLRTRVSLEEGQKAASVRKEVPVCNGYRRFYSTQLVNSDLQTEKRWLLEGHNLKANDSSYVKVTNDDLLSQFMKAHDNLLISQEKKLRQRVQKLEVEKSQIEALALELEKVKRAIKKKKD